MKNGSLVLAAALLATLVLTGCGSTNTDAKATPNTTTATTPAPKPSKDDRAAAEQTYEDAQREFEEFLEEIDGAMGETLGIQPGTYEATANTPDYEDPLDALDDEYLDPGTYTSMGPADGSSGCYWARMSDASGDSSSILANDMTEGRAIVTLNEGEFFKTSGCKPWTKQVD
ncbi:hypothetical protein J7E87_23595 [Streptomyces sp. ISL-1]|uniref:hypothetical protein n=1 Tax=Streptomyces sp. ISL-1 TaxID=2817657 RepID=UPI001BEBDCC6|nr:hypothetical protein [Streptomyces sp. ISL-1]MBT2392322.1 hypothetical protein [Streptomyces sp. ISL-1]